MIKKRNAAVLLGLILAVGQIADPMALSARAADAFEEEAPAFDASSRVTHAVSGGKLYFEPDTGAITWAEGTMEELTIPDKINGKEVRVINRWALSGLDKLKRINLPESRNVLGEGSLAELTALEECVVPPVCDAIPKSCFYGCTSLKKVSLPASVANIGEMAFYGCESLEYADIPGNCMSLGKMAFYNCTSLKGVAFVDGSACDISGWGIFYNCKSLEKAVNIPALRFSFFYESGKRAEKWLNYDGMIESQSEMWRLRFPTNEDRDNGITILDESVIKEREDAIRAKAEEVTSGCSGDREKVAAVMQWIIDNIDYEKGHDNHPWAVYTGILDVQAGKKTEQLNSCGGYSNMTQVMLQSLGIPCATLWRENRNGETIDHEFCAAYFEGKWRWLDTTHSDDRKEGLELDFATAGFFYNSDHRVDYMLYRSGKDGDTDIYKLLPSDIPVEADVKDWADQNPADAYIAAEAEIDPDWVYEPDPSVIAEEAEKIAKRASEFPEIPVSDPGIFTFDKETGTITGLSSDSETRINIPESIDGVTVKAIADEAFQYKYKIEYITMPDTITEIGKNAFQSCRGLKRIHLSAAITEIKEGTLSGCSSMDSLTIPKSVKRLDTDIVRNCSSLEEALFEDYDFKIKVIETDPLGSDDNYNAGLADINWHCFVGMSGRALHGLDFHETYIGTKYYRQLQDLDLTTDWRTNIVNIHQSQRGYREGFSPYHIDGSNSMEFRLSPRAIDYEWGHFAECSRFTGYQPATWCRAFIEWAYAMAGVKGYESTEYQWDDLVYAGKGGTVELEPGDMLGMGATHWCMVGSVKELSDSVELWIIHGNHTNRMVMDETLHYNKETGICIDTDDDDEYNYFRALYKIDFSSIETQTVKLDPMGGTCRIESRTYSKRAYYGCLPDAEKDDYVFDGWYTEPEGGLRAYPYRNLTDDVTTLYAHYTYNPKGVKGVTLDREEVQIGVGEKLTLNAAVMPADADNTVIKWRSGNREVVTVEDGVLTGLQKGTATILARTAGGPYVAYCEVTVGEGSWNNASSSGSGLDPVPVIEKNGSEWSTWLVKGQTLKLGAGTWTSANKKIAAVNKSGKVTAKAKGQTTVSGKTTDGDEITLTVTVAVSTISKNTMKLLVGDTAEALSLSFGDADASKYPVSWISSKGSVASVDEKGVVTALGKGSAVIYGYSGGKSASCKVTVTDNVTSLNQKSVAYGGEIRMNPLSVWSPKYKKADGGSFTAKGAIWGWSSDTEAAYTAAQDMKEILNSGGEVIGYENDIVQISASNGKIKAVGTGTVKLFGIEDTANPTENDMTCVIVTVMPVPQKKTAYIEAGKSLKLSHLNVKSSQAVWSLSESSGLVSVEEKNGVYTGKLKASAGTSGSVDVTASFKGFSYTTAVYVENPLLTTDDNITGSGLNYRLSDMTVGAEKELKLTGVYQKPLFKSSKNSVVFVDENGTLHARGAGKAVVSVKVGTRTLKINVEVN